MHGTQGQLDVEKLGFTERQSFDAGAAQMRPDVNVVTARKVSFELYDLPKLVGLAQQFIDQLTVVGEPYFVHVILPQRTDARFFQALADRVETKFVF